MQHTFGEWYEPDDSTLKQILESGTIALDANVLLDLYRTGTDQRTQILSLFERPYIRRRVWIPYQVGLEFQRNRLEVARQHQPQYEKIRTDVAKLEASMSSALSGVRDTEVQKSIREVVAENLSAAAKAITSHLNALENQHVIAYEKIRIDDPLRARLDDILADPEQVGPKPDDVTIEERKKAATDRYEREVPPGYLDANKPDNSHGDVLIWFEILDHAEKFSRPVLFVTSDVKPDWYRREAGDNLGPRPELKSEFATRSPHPYHQVRLSTFLHLANQYLNAGVSGETISSVEELAENRRAAFRKTRIEELSRRLRRPSTKRGFVRALGLYEPGTKEYAALRAGIDLIEGERTFNATEADTALRVLDQSIRRFGPIGDTDSIESRERMLDRIRDRLAVLGPFDDDERKIMNELAQKLDAAKFLEFLQAYEKQQELGADWKVNFSEALSNDLREFGEADELIDRTRPLF